MIEKDITDKEFTEWLSKFGKWSYLHFGYPPNGYTNYYDQNDNHVALVVYSHINRRIFIREKS
jgi:hypothetical protein